MQKLNKNSFEKEDVPSDQALLVGSAYKGKPTQEKALVYVYEGHEYIVPVSNKWNGKNVTESLVRLDQAERVVSRPYGTSCISEMKRTKEISPRAQEALIKGIHAWFLPEKGYIFCIVPFEIIPT